MATFQDKVQTTNASGLVVATPAGATGGTAIAALKITPTANAASANVMTVTNASLAQASTITIPDPGAATASFMVAPSSAVATAPQVFTRIITAGQAALASGGSVTVQAHTSATCQFAIIDVKVIKSTGLSGGGGDRLLNITDGTIVFNNAGITAALLGTPVTTVWGGSGNPLPASTVAITTTAGADLVLKYAGGTTDFTAGSVIVAVTLAQVTL